MSMRRVKKILLFLLLVFIVIQFIQPERNKDGRVLAMDISKTVVIPQSLYALLQTACYDCHSNNTNYPWYAYLQPIGWILNKHILNGKEQLNFSEFGSYSSRRQQSKLKSIASQVKDDAMPLSSYTWIHKKARLTMESRMMIIDWATKTKDSLETKK